MSTKKIVLITGATSGIGKACATLFAANGWQLIITGRRAQRLAELKTFLQKKYPTTCLTLCFDVQDKTAVQQHLQSLPKEWQSIDVLINNAGLALGRDAFDTANIDDWETMIDTNIKGLLYVSKAIIPYFIQHHKGHIINIGSVAGKEVYEKGNVYCATKHAVVAISKAQRIDLVQHGIKVTCINPGATETEFSLVRFKGDTTTAASIYNGYKALADVDIADVIYYTATLPPHVCINDVDITCTQQANATTFYKS